ncbi:MAG: hypothetical protein HQK52_16080 [Oligoflexia bacterium]|nr:hypothetical protein [Oligoflexia bacterium]
MIFLIEFDRKNRTLVKFEKFNDCELEKAEKVRLELELNQLKTMSTNEIVILESESEDILRQTHGRYFTNPSSILDEMGLSKGKKMPQQC